MAPHSWRSLCSLSAATEKGTASLQPSCCGLLAGAQQGAEAERSCRAGGGGLGGKPPLMRVALAKVSLSCCSAESPGASPGGTSWPSREARAELSLASPRAAKAPFSLLGAACTLLRGSLSLPAATPSRAQRLLAGAAAALFVTALQSFLQLACKPSKSPRTRASCCH